MNHKRPWQLAVFLGALGATSIVQRQFARYSLQTDRTPHGIIDFELAGSTGRAREILDAWRAADVLDNVRPNIAIIDALFIPCYTTMLLTGCAWASGAFDGRLAALGRQLAAAQLLTAALDYGENAALLRAFDALHDTASRQRLTHWPTIAALCAWPKFALVVTGGAYIVAGAIVSVGRWLAR